MKNLYTVCIALLCCLCCEASAQNTFEEYFKGKKTYTVVADASKGLTAPHDLDFVPGRPNEWWILNKASSGSFVTIIYNMGTPEQKIETRKDSHRGHFMAQSVAIAMGDNGAFGSAQEILNTSSGSTFMGPALWSNDTSIFARINQNNWVDNQPLGSHLDMLHQSPFGMGIAHEKDNVYWYFDGYNNDICRYDFQEPHAIGADDHADGIIHRYSDVSVLRRQNIPSHMVLDKETGWLYIVDTGNKRILRINTTTGNPGDFLSAPNTSNEPLGEYREVTGVVQEVVTTTGLTVPSGIDYKDGRIVVSDNSTGYLMMYDVTQTPAKFVGLANTGAKGIMGVKIDNDNKIWFVNNTTKQLIRVDADVASSVTEEVLASKGFTLQPNPASEMVTIQIGEIGQSASNDIAVYDVLGVKIFSTTFPGQEFTIDVQGWPKGVYMISVHNEKAKSFKKLIVN